MRRPECFFIFFLFERTDKTFKTLIVRKLQYKFPDPLFFSQPFHNALKITADFRIKFFYRHVSFHLLQP